MSLHVVRSTASPVQAGQGLAGAPARSRLLGGRPSDLPSDVRHRPLVLGDARSIRTLGRGPAVMRFIASSKQAGLKPDWRPVEPEREHGEADPAMEAHLDRVFEQLGDHLSDYLSHHLGGPLASLFGDLLAHSRELGEFLEPLCSPHPTVRAQAVADGMARAMVEDLSWARRQGPSPLQRLDMDARARRAKSAPQTR